MRQMMGALLLVTAMAILPAWTAALDEGKTAEIPQAFKAGWSWCDMGNEAQALGPYPPSPDETCEVWVHGAAACILHQDAVFNCCIDDIEVSVERIGYHIRILEEEVWTQPCWCFCYFPVWIDLWGLDPGEYSAQVWSRWMDGQEELRCTLSFVIGEESPPLGSH